MTQNDILLTIESLAELAAVQQPPCLSLYQTTHRHRPENQQDPIRFRNLVKILETSLRQRYSDIETRLFLERFESLSHDHAFWEHTQDGLAVLGGPTNSPDKIEPGPGVLRTMTEALGSELTDSHQTVASYGGTGQGSSPMRHADGGRRDEVQIDAERFFLPAGSTPRQARSKLPMRAILTSMTCSTISANWSGRWAAKFLSFRRSECRRGLDWRPPSGIETNGL